MAYHALVKEAIFLSIFMKVSLESCYFTPLTANLRKQSSIWRFNTVTLSRCAVKCMADQSCLLIRYEHRVGTCYAYDYRKEKAGGLTTSRVYMSCKDDVTDTVEGRKAKPLPQKTSHLTTETPDLTTKADSWKSVPVGYKKTDIPGCFYKLYKVYKPRKEARAICMKDGGDLIQLDTEQKHKYIVRKLKKQYPTMMKVWTGLYRGRKWKYHWLNGKTYTFMWTLGDPSYYNEHCAYVSGFGFSDCHCTDPHHFLCEIITGPSNLG